NKTLPKIKTEILKDQSVQSCLKGDKVDLTLLHDKLAPDISGKKESFFKVLDEAFRFEDGAISRVFFHLEGGFLDGEPVVNLSKKDEEITKMELLISELLFLKAFHESSSRYDLRDVIYRSLKKINEQKKEIKEMDTLSTDVENFLSSEKDILISDDK
ncbi:MAG: hypothetical protein HYS39_02520, partial [Proteobacteria bacterium]|nr:hypothetical protein [Pseudomonadota bacterium]